MFENIAKGFVVGLMVSSPMGPINMLTIQRTLSSGRKHGIATGMGAMLSDLIYAILTMTAMEFVSQFQAEYDLWLQLFGGTVLVLFGWFVFQTNPMKRLRPSVSQEGGQLLKDFISSFLLTFSNVGIVVVFVGLYTRFSFNPLSEGLAYLIAGVSAFILAAVGWWVFLTFFISRLRKRFNRKALILLNRIVGTLFMVIGLGGVLHSLFLFFN